MKNIIIDAMGGDNAPAAIVKGAVDAQKEFGVNITLVGMQDEILACLKKNGISSETEHIKIVHAPDVIDMCDDPSTAVRRKKDSSMSKALYLLRDGEGDACISAGSTGALLAGATLVIKRIHGIKRAALAPVLPNGGKGVVLIDCGANVECTTEQLLQFAYMGSFYSGRVLGCDRPKVGLLNVGAEESKGTDLQRAAHELLSGAHNDGRINFIGNVEGNDLLTGKVDVIVTDGFAGNVALKCIEGSAKMIMRAIKDTLMSSAKGKIAGLLIKNDISALKSGFDASETGGTALLGISMPVIKAHGSSDARAVRSAVKQAIAFIDSGMIDEIKSNVGHMQLDTASE